jgi:hypothetical protein
VVEIDNLLLHRAPPGIYSLGLLAVAPGKTVQAKEIAIVCLHDVLFCRVAVQLAKLHEIRGIDNGLDNGFPPVPGAAARRGRQVLKEALGATKKQINDRGRQSESHDANEALEQQQDDRRQKAQELPWVQAAKKWNHGWQAVAGTR